MKFTVRFADQIVGLLIILAVGALIFVVFMLGSNQRWFSRDYHFKSYFNSASGLSKNMVVLYKGFPIGHVKSFELTDDDRVEVWFTIFDTYISRVRYGSVVEVIQSPIGLGNQFFFYPGQGEEQVGEGELIPAIGSPEGRWFLAEKLVSIPQHDDSISIIMNRLNSILTQVEEAFAGTDQTTLGRTLGNVEEAAAGLRDVSEMLPETLNDFIVDIMGQLGPILTDLNALSGRLADPDGAVTAFLDSEGEVYTNLVDSLESISGTLRNLEKTSEFIPSQLPQVARLLADLQTTLRTAEDVLVALTNNPLLKNGIPPRVETRTGGTSPRDISF
ncbi:MAG: MlaD family protein [Treponema sp.]|jgi:phospholipid/cholesterol/gamma-HCH transport system substrate-binding protein|nr:MlaD family protein [Treponema sp.]